VKHACCAALIAMVAAALWMIPLIRPGGAAPPPPPMVVGGPFQRVVYNFGTHTSIATPGLLREGPLVFKAPSIQYNDVTHIGWADGACSITDGTETATSNHALADFARRIITLGGAVHITFQLVRKGQSPASVVLNCPSVTYQSSNGTARCDGGISGTISGIQELPGATIARLAPGPKGQAPAPSGPASVQAAVVTYDSHSRLLEASGWVVLSQGGSVIKAQGLTFDLNRNTLRMVGSVGYSDSAGRQLTGSQAIEDLERKSVLVIGPVTYTDRQKNRIQAASATLDQGSQVASFTGGVRYTNADGFVVQTPWASIQSLPNSAQRIQTGPLRMQGAAGV